MTRLQCCTPTASQPGHSQPPDVPFWQVPLALVTQKKQEFPAGLGRQRAAAKWSLQEQRHYTSGRLETNGKTIGVVLCQGALWRLPAACGYGPNAEPDLGPRDISQDIKRSAVAFESFRLESRLSYFSERPQGKLISLSLMCDRRGRTLDYCGGLSGACLPNALKLSTNVKSA